MEVLKWIMMKFFTQTNAHHCLGISFYESWNVIDWWEKP
jgi:hypothetical protein